MPTPLPPGRPLLRAGPPLLSRRAAQARGVWLILLLAGHELQAVSANISSGQEHFSHRGASDDFGANLTEASHLKSPAHGLTTLAQHAGDLARRTAGSIRRLLVATVENWQWPQGTKLKLTSTNVAGDAVHVESPTQVTLMAGLLYNYLEIQATGTVFGSDHDLAKIKLVTEYARRHDCEQTLQETKTKWSLGEIAKAFNMPVANYTGMNTDNPPVLAKLGPAAMGYSLGAMALTNNGDKLMAGSLGNSMYKIMFMWGGAFQLCYTPDGDFGSGDGTQKKNNVVPTSVLVIGIRSPCKEDVHDGCMDKERWDCFFGYKGENVVPCNFNVKDDGGRKDSGVQWRIYPGTKSKMTWTQAWGADYMDSGSLQYRLKLCTAAEPEKAKFGIPASGDSVNIQTFLDLDGTNDANMPAVASTETDPFTVSACYCPNYEVQSGKSCETDGSGCCDDYEEYLQQFGVVYWWTISICDKSNYANCNPPYMRVIPQQEFVLKVKCPPGGGCLATVDNRIKFIAHSAANDKPNWMEDQGCRTTSTESENALWPQSRVQLSGGDDTNFKVWASEQVKFRLSVKQELDVCFANKQSEQKKSWFRIGTVRTVEAFGFASSIGVGASVKTIKYVNHPGSVTLYGGITSGSTLNPYDSNKFSGKGLLNLLSFDRDENYGIGDQLKTMESFNEYNKRTPSNFQTRMDAECQKEEYYPTLIQGPWNKLDAKTYIAKVDDVVNNYLTFSGENKDRTLTVLRSGVVAVCYCAILSSQNQCAEPRNWVYSGRMTVRGPVGGQQWIFPTEIVVKMEVTGWGMTGQDKIRIIPATSACSNANNQPDSDITFKVGCPSTQPAAIGEIGCRFAETITSIGVNVRSATSATNYVKSIDVGQQSSTLTFSQSIEGVLDPEDVITIDMDRIRVNNKREVAMTPQEKFEAYKLAAEMPFQDDTAQMYLVGQRVTEVKVNNVVDYTKMQIPVGWPTTNTPSFSFYNQEGIWTRRNKEETTEEIKGMTAKSGLKACWGVTDVGGVTKYYAQAGEVEFKDPPPMKAAKINLSTKMDGAESPVVISFKTGAQREEYSRTKTGASALMLRFLDVSESNGKLVPRKTGDKPPNTGSPPPFTDGEFIGRTNLKQMICGRLFIELWSSDPEGFPMPAGCYFGKKYKDNEERDIVQKFFREFFLEFPEGSGLRQNTDYQIVMNTQVRNIAKGDVLVDLYTMCVGTKGCERPYQVFEKGSAEASKSTEAPATLSDPSFGTDGFLLQRGNPQTGVLNLSDMNILQFKLTGGEDNAAIIANCLVRVYLWPLTLWAVGEGSCSAECRKYHANNRKCEGPVGCTPEEVVPGSERRNVIKIQLPTEMHDITGTTTHTIKVTGITLPVGGYFPSRVGAQVTRPDDSRPDYKTSTGFLMKNAEPGETTGRLVVSGRTGYGDKPFAADTNNVLYLRLSFGATVWNLGENNAAFVEITLPKGYTCKVPGGDGMPDWNLDIFTADNNNDGYYDSVRGYMSTRTTDGDWENSAGKKCIYEVRPYMALYAGMVFYVKVTVDNPGEPLRKTDESNIWSIRLQSKGMQELGVPFDQNEENFITLQQEKDLGPTHWGGNSAVLSPLIYETLQPTHFRRSTASYQQTEDLYVFFRTSQYIGRNGFVLLDSPVGFDFGANCMSGPLPDEYYVFRGENEDKLLPLKNIKTCSGQRFPTTSATYNRAKSEVGGILDKDKHYGFKIRITHPLYYQTDQHITWYLWTQDSEGYGVDGSTATIKFNRNQAASDVQPYHKAWGMYNGPFLNDFHIEIADMTPNSISQAYSIVTIFPFRFDVFTDTSLRITAPLGYMWNSNPDSFTGKMNQSTADITEAPAFVNHNQLIWNSISFANDQTYGFTAKIKVPDLSPVVSSNAFFVEMGWNKAIIDERMMAAVIPTNAVKTLTDCGVSYASNLMSYQSNRMEFRFNTITPLYENEGVVIKGDVSTMGFTFACGPILLPGSMTLPSDIKCDTDKGNDDLPKITLKVAQTALMPGNYAFEMAAINPTRRILQTNNWKFGTYKNVKEYPDGAPIDKESSAPGFTINGELLDARLISITEKQRSLTMRNDRPEKPNQLIFRFRVKYDIPNEADLQLRGPRGFEFEEDCLSSVKTSANEVFGPNTASLWPMDYDQWPAQFAPIACVGEGRFATITIPVGLGRRNLYAFRMGVLKNPTSTPEWNKWTIDYNGESSVPFEGFTVWTFTHTSVQPVSLAKSPTGANVILTINPITITFRPFNRVKFKCTSCQFGGLLRLSAPTGFQFVEDNGDCVEPQLMETGGAVKFTPADMSCQVEHKTKLLLELIGDKAVEANRDYTLIVNSYNPTSTALADYWALHSFSERTAMPHQALDEHTTILGQDINNVLNTFTVINKNNLRNGKAKVNDVEFTLQFPDPLKDKDEIEVLGPKGFDLEGNPELGDCKEFRWPANTVPLPETGAPECACANDICKMLFRINENKDPAFPQNENIQFTVATQNPTRTPFVTDNFWRVSHKRGGIVRSSHIYPSWPINPQLEDVTIELSGQNQAAGTTSDLVFTFTPVSDADTIQIEALFPTEFDFGRATVPVPYDIDNLSEREMIIINRCSIVAGRTQTIRINSVKLGRGGGQTKFNMITYSDETRAHKSDEKLEYTGGFRLPGKVTIDGKELKSKFKEERQLFPVKSLFQARVGEEAKAEFVLMFSQKVAAAQKLVISCEGEGAYELKVSPFVIIGKERVETSVERAANKFTEISATLKPGRPATDVALQADTPYTIIMWVIPKQGTNTWLFKTSDEGAYPTNTNDGVTTGFRPVEQMSLQVQAIRSPPRAIIDVTLNVDQRSAVVLELLVIAPPSFVFPPTGCGDMCQAGQALGSTGRRTATIASPTGEPLTRLNNLRIQVQTPEQTPDSITWFVEGRGQGKGVTTGWGEGDGFRVTQMANSLTSYAGVAGLRAAQITFRFVLEVNAGSEIAIEPPSGYLLSCSTEGALKQISLPGGRPGCTDDPLVLMLSTTLTAGEYAFGVAVDLPPQEPSPNSFNIIIRDRDNNVVDAAYELAGVDIIPLPVTSPTLSWTRAEPAQPSRITIGITFTMDTNLIKALLIKFPNKFIHDVQKPTDVQNLNRRFPVAASQAGGWADTSDTDRIKILLDDSEDSTTIAADTYSWSFPVLVPSTEMPRYNVWFFSLCSDRTCREPRGRGVIVSFPMAGFQLNEVSPTSMKSEINGAPPRAGAGFYLALTLAISNTLSGLLFRTVARCSGR